MSTIPANTLVDVIPSVISAGGDALDVIGLFLTTNTRVPIGSVLSFASAAAVSNFFGPTSKEAAQAAIYFAGFNGSTALPGSILFAQYNTAAVGAYLQGGNVSSVPLATLQGYGGLLQVTINGALQQATFNLSGATSFSNAASIIGSNLGIAGPQAAAFTGSISGNTLTVSGGLSPAAPLAVGDVISGSGVVANTYVTGILNVAANGTGTYSVNSSQTALSAPMTALQPGVTYDSVSGAFIVVSNTVGANSTITYGSGALATSLLLTQLSGAVLSQGAAAATPAAFMNNVVSQTTNWATFKLMFDPDNGSGFAQKMLFAQWKNTALGGNRFGYVAIDTDPVPPTETPDPSSFAAALAAVSDSGTCLIWEPAGSGEGLSQFICGAAASINFQQTNGRITFAFKWQNGLAAAVTTQTAAQNLLANGYNFGGAYGAANQNFTWFQNGQCTGPFKWFDSYINQIWLNNAFQLALLALLQNSLSIPYNAAGNALIAAALAGPIQAGLNFGAFAPGTISAAEISAVNTQAGTNVAGVLQTQGWALQILPASASARNARSSPPCTFWYLDRGSVQQINLASVSVD
jgi:hypothetical protein